MKRWLAGLVWVALSCASASGIGASIARAQEETPETEDAAESRSTAFEAARGAQREAVPGGALMIGAYSLVWLLLLAYVATLGLRQARTAREIERLRRDLALRGDEKGD